MKLGGATEDWRRQEPLSNLDESLIGETGTKFLDQLRFRVVTTNNRTRVVTANDG